LLCYLCFVEKDCAVLPAVLGPDDGLGLHGEMVHAVVVPVVLQYVPLSSPLKGPKHEILVAEFLRNSSLYGEKT
jgi:hypothetical protein